MKKTLFFSLFITIGLLTCAQADYVWTGAVSHDWADQNNWTMTNGSTWNVSNLGPMVPNSNMWDNTVIDGSLARTPAFPTQLEGWVPNLTLINGAQITTSFRKIQAAGNGTIFFQVDETSKLIISGLDNTTPRDGNASWIIKSFEGLTFSNQTLQGGGGGNPVQTINLDLLGSIKTQQSFGNSLVCNFSGQLGLDIDSVQAQLHVGQFSLVSGGTEYNVVRRRLYDSNESSGTAIDFSGSSFTNLNGENLTKSSSGLNATADDLNKFYIYQQDNDVFVQYVTTVPIPEPSSASLGLLSALALLARRRRRH